MKNFDIKQIYFLDESLVSIEKEDKQGFKLLATEPDKQGTLPVVRVSDGDYQCLPAEYLIIDVKITGQFGKLLNGRVVFVPAEPIMAAKFGFYADTTNNPVQQWVSEEIQFNFVR